ncbi:MAG: hypothetical protein IPP74_02720 [Alphaproteobacteria bacterium]|nr:hypothetical protein [Alphaproteobacteria bacterium]
MSKKTIDIDSYLKETLEYFTSNEYTTSRKEYTNQDNSSSKEQLPEVSRNTIEKSIPSLADKGMSDKEIEEYLKKDLENLKRSDAKPVGYSNFIRDVEKRIGDRFEEDRNDRQAKVYGHLEDVCKEKDITIQSAEFYKDGGMKITVQEKGKDKDVYFSAEKVAEQSAKLENNNGSKQAGEEKVKAYDVKNGAENRERNGTPIVGNTDLEATLTSALEGNHKSSVGLKNKSADRKVKELSDEDIKNLDESAVKKFFLDNKPLEKESAESKNDMLKAKRDELKQNDTKAKALGFNGDEAKQKVDELKNDPDRQQKIKNYTPQELDSLLLPDTEKKQSKREILNANIVADAGKNAVGNDKIQPEDARKQQLINYVEGPSDVGLQNKAVDAALKKMSNEKMNSLSAKELQEHFKEKDVKRFLDAAKTEREKEGGNKNAKWSDFAKTELADKKQELIDKDKQKEQEPAKPKASEKVGELLGNHEEKLAQGVKDTASAGKTALGAMGKGMALTVVATVAAGVLLGPVAIGVLAAGVIATAAYTAYKTGGKISDSQTFKDVKHTAKEAGTNLVVKALSTAIVKGVEAIEKKNEEKEAKTAKKFSIEENGKEVGKGLKDLRKNLKGMKGSVSVEFKVGDETILKMMDKDVKDIRKQLEKPEVRKQIKTLRDAKMSESQQAGGQSHPQTPRVEVKSTGKAK